MLLPGERAIAADRGRIVKRVLLPVYSGYVVR
jgi:hypothetical protein